MKNLRNATSTIKKCSQASFFGGTKQCSTGCCTEISFLDGSPVQSLCWPESQCPLDREPSQLVISSSELCESNCYVSETWGNGNLVRKCMSGDSAHLCSTHAGPAVSDGVIVGVILASFFFLLALILLYFKVTHKKSKKTIPSPRRRPPTQTAPRRETNQPQNQINVVLPPATPFNKNSLPLCESLLNKTLNQDCTE